MPNIFIQKSKWKGVFCDIFCATKLFFLGKYLGMGTLIDLDQLRRELVSVLAGNFVGWLDL